MPSLPVTSPGVRPQRAPSRAELEGRVTSLQVSSGANLTLESRQRILLSAIPLDVNGAPIHGLHAEWQSSDQGVIFVRKNGEAIAGRPGAAILTAQAGLIRQIIAVTVLAGTLDEFGGSEKETSTRSQRQRALNSSRSIPRTAVAKRNHPVDGIYRGDRNPGSAVRDKSTMLPNPRPPCCDPDYDPLPDNETSSLYQASNATGSPRGKKKAGALTPATATDGNENGNQNFMFGLPLFSLAGRGIDASLGLVYNSQVWNKSINPGDNSTWLTYDVDIGWPAPGFRIGYGQIENQGSFGMTLTDADGTRHELAYTSTNNYDTTDGTFIHYTGSSGSGTLYYADGMQVTYGAAGGGYRSYPTQIKDRNGNYILISYVSGVGPKISSIEDTLGRYVNFYYASNGDLVTITQPGLTGYSDLQVMRFYYDDVTIPQSGLFASPLNVSGAPSSVHTLKYVFLPSATTTSTHIGYRFDYSAYGMVYQITQFRGMTVSSTSTSSAGSVTNEGTQAALTTYDYPTTACALIDVPKYAHRTDDWAGRTTSVGGNAPSYTFDNSTATGEKISTVTAPDGTIVETHTIDNGGGWNDGLVKETKVEYGTAPTVLSDTVIDWEPTPGGGPPRIADVKVTNESGLTKATVFSYTTSYNNVSGISECDFTTDGSISSTVLRRTETTYVSSSNYTNRHLLRLPSTVKVFSDGSTTSPSSRVDYAYDDYGTSHANLTARNDIIMHDPAFDPFQPTQQINCHWVCMDWEPPHTCFDWEWVCTNYNPYDPNTDYRGNLTSVTTYPDSTSSSGTITHSTTYDIAGNVMTTQVDCCQLKSFTYSGAGTNGNHDYAYPISVASGGSGTTLTSSATYDYNTGLVATSSDENSQVTYYSYTADSLQLAGTTYPNGTYTNIYYHPALLADTSGRLHYAISIARFADSTHYLDSYRWYDGRGAVTQTFDNWTSANGWSTQDIEYDVMGRAYRASNPYYCGGYGWVAINPDGFWTTSTFDHLGRVTQVTMPRGDNDNTLTTSASSTYSGVYTTVTDQAGKVRRQKVDALGRVIRLDEPTSSGLGDVSAPNQATNYTYDSLDNLVRINQGSQDRYFKYDSLSRLIRERQVEQTTNSSYDLSDSITGNSAWTRKIDYNSSGLVTDAYDARSVHTKFTYDGLNRVIQIEYLKPGNPNEVAEGTPTAHYYYDSQSLPNGAPSTSSPDNYARGYSTGRLVGMTYGSSTSTTGDYFGYDNMGRVNIQFQLTGSTPAKYKLTYGYNYLDEITSETYPSGRALTYAYDEGGRLSSVGDGTTTFASGFQYAPHGGLTSETWGNTSVHSMNYNRRLQASQAKLALGSSVLQQYDYGYGEFNTSTGVADTSKNNGQIGNIKSTIGSTTQWLQGFQYDELERLKNVAEYQGGSMSSQTYSEGYTFDRFGNRFQSGNSTLGLQAISSSEINAATNRFINTGPTPTTYDPAGNILTDTKFRNMNFSYDANGRTTFAEHTDHTNQQNSVYDCVGQRVQTSVNNTTRTMVYDIFGQDVADYTGSSGATLERENIYRGGQLLATDTPIPVPVFSDNFNSTSLDTSKWSVVDPNSSAVVTDNGQQLQITLQPNTAAYNGVYSNSTYDLTGKNFQVEEAQPISQAGWCENFIELVLDGNNYFLIDSGAGSLVLRSMVGGANDQTVLTFDQTAHHYWRIRHDQSTNTIKFETSADGSTWTTRKSAAVGFSLTSLRLYLYAGAWGTGNGSPGAAKYDNVQLVSNSGGLNYVFSDIQGSARAMMSNNGSNSAVIARHDYLPFGEEISAGVGLRTSSQGFGATDTNRQKYGLLERDDATGLDHTWWRKYENLSGRWTSPDPYNGSITIADPQSFHRYNYTQNDPINFIDPSGLDGEQFPVYYVCVGGTCVTWFLPGALVVNVGGERPGPAGLTGSDFGSEMGLLEYRNVGGNPFIQIPVSTSTPTPQKPAPKQNTPAQQKQSRRDCILSAAKTYLGAQFLSMAKMIAFKAGVDVFALITVLSLGTSETVEGLEALHLADAQSRIGAASGVGIMGLSYLLAKELIQPIRNNSQYQEALQKCFAK